MISSVKVVLIVVTLFFCFAVSHAQQTANSDAGCPTHRPSGREGEARKGG